MQILRIQVLPLAIFILGLCISRTFAIDSAAARCPPSPPTRSDLVAAARDVYSGLRTKMDVGDRLTEEKLELLHTWSQRIRNAEQQLDVQADGAVAQAREHLKRMEDLEDRLKRTYDLPQTIFQMAHYFVVEAKLDVEKSQDHNRPAATTK